MPVNIHLKNITVGSVSESGQAMGTSSLSERKAFWVGEDEEALWTVTGGLPGMMTWVLGSISVETSPIP